MKRRFQPGEALLFYAAAFGCALAFFLLGVYAGRSFFPAPAPPAVAIQNDAAPGESARPDLNFYNDLVPPDKERKEDDSRQGTSLPEETGAEPTTAAASEPGKRSGEVVTGAASPAGAASRKSPASPLRRFVTVQVGALNSREEARQVMIRLEAKGYAGRLVEPAGRGDFYRVWVGEFDTESEARSLEARLKKDDFHTYVKMVEEPRSN